MSNQNICNICGANYEYRGGRWKCPACGAYKAEELSNEEVTLFYNAAQKLRLCDFDEAEKAYTDIIEKFPKNANGYWGRLLSRYGIKYEEDFDGRKIPTCYAASIESVLSDKDYHKALELADADTKAYFEQQAQYIERVRKEWIERAKKEKPYDIFICYKDSDLANGIDRTQDSIAAQDLYIHLTEQGYRVFFSRESLRDKVGEKYEPYIFNALSTAKVMLVYGTSSEYITSTWLKNEWTRYEKRLQAGEKKPNSLIVACDGFSPAELPKALSSMQCFDATKRSFYTDLDVVLKKIIKGEGKPKPVTKENKEKKKSKKIPVAIATISALIAVFLCILIPNLLNTQPVTSIVDSKYGVVITAQEGVFDKNTTVSVERLSDGTQYESLVSAVNDSKSIELQNAIIYDINCDADINTNVTVKVSYAKNKADSTVKVYYVSDDKATVEEHSCTYDNGSVEFKTTHFSYYVVGEIVTENDDSSDNQDKNNDNQNSSSIGGENTGDDITPPPPEVKEATINFNANGGSGSMSEQTVTVGKSTNLKECSYTKSGYTFSGWATSTSGSVVYTDRASFNAESESEITLYAIWVPNTNSLVFNSNGGSGAMDTVSIKTDETITLPVNTFSKTGYTFIGWSNVQNGSVIYTDGQSFSMISSATVTLYAVWTANTNTLNFNSNGGSGTMSPMYIKTDAQTILTKSNFTKEGYTFVGWSTTPTGIMQYLDEASYTMGTDATTTLYAVWTAENYSIEYNLNGGTENDNPYSYTIETETFSLVSPKRSGYKFLGWTGTDLSEFTQNVTIYKGSMGVRSYTANWELIQDRSLIFNSNGGNGTMQKISVAEGQVLPLPKNLFSRDGYRFVGWGTSADGDVVYRDQTEYTVGSDEMYVLYAIWKYGEYSDGLKFSSDFGETYYISGYNGMDVDVIIPSTYNGKPVIGIGYNAFERCSIKSVKLPESIQYICGGAFGHCEYLEFIVIPDSVTEIQTLTFESCYNLKSIVLPEKLEHIASSAFRYCYDLKNIQIPKTCSKIGDRAFYSCQSLAEILLPMSISKIGEGAFWECDALTTIYCEVETKPSGWHDNWNRTSCKVIWGYGSYTEGLVFELKNDGTYAVIGYEGTECNVIIPSTYNGIPVTKIAKSAFYNCTILKKITIPSSVIDIDAAAFNGCSSLEIMNIPTVGKFVDPIENTGEKGFYRFGYIFGTEEYDNSFCYKQDWVYFPYGYDYNMIYGGFTQNYYIPKSLKKIVIGEAETPINTFEIEGVEIIWKEEQ